ncbi:hypothetical protein ABZY81_15745 [Streptomyces sp. NPDC006514]|uniref:hypothetical protein n=1 Tax=Streptomyces sp. NPDC006514 TaxID=3154308 RepID=UPI0033AF415A
MVPGPAPHLGHLLRVTARQVWRQALRRPRIAVTEVQAGDAELEPRPTVPFGP